MFVKDFGCAITGIKKQKSDFRIGRIVSTKCEWRQYVKTEYYALKESIIIDNFLISYKMKRSAFSNLALALCRSLNNCGLKQIILGFFLQIIDGSNNIN